MVIIMKLSIKNHDLNDPLGSPQTKLYGRDQQLKLHYHFKLGSLGDPAIFNLQHSDCMWDTPMMTRIGMGASHMEY